MVEEDATRAELTLRNDSEEAWSVGELSRRLKRSVEGAFSQVRVRGEISQVHYSGAGHCYINLKDDSAVLRAIAWKGVVGGLSMVPEEGLEVIAVGRITTYEARSEYQLIIEHLEMAGEGALLKLLEERKRKLEAEGLFSATHKRDLPDYPNVLGVITSEHGAVIRDIENRLAERLPVRVYLYPVTVQGDSASAEISRAIAFFNDSERLSAMGIVRPDLLIVARGGGSVEDLLPFSDEALVRAAFASEIPIISAVGHETDWSLLDYVADARAPTPTAAAEMAVCTKLRFMELIAGYLSGLQVSVRRYLELCEHRLEALRRGLVSPERWWELRSRKFDDVCEHLRKNMRAVETEYNHRLSRIVLRLPMRISDYEALPARQWEALRRSMEAMLARREVRLEHAARLLENCRYRRVLARGFAIVRARDSGGEWGPRGSLAAVGSASELEIEFYDGRLPVHVRRESAKTAGTRGSAQTVDTRGSVKNVGKSNKQSKLFD